MILWSMTNTHAHLGTIRQLKPDPGCVSPRQRFIPNLTAELVEAVEAMLTQKTKKYSKTEQQNHIQRQMINRHSVITQTAKPDQMYGTPYQGRWM